MSSFSEFTCGNFEERLDDVLTDVFLTDVHIVVDEDDDARIK